MAQGWEKAAIMCPFMGTYFQLNFASLCTNFVPTLYHFVPLCTSLYHFVPTLCQFCINFVPLCTNFVPSLYNFVPTLYQRRYDVGTESVRCWYGVSLLSRLSTQHMSCVSTRQMSWLSTRHMSCISTLRYAQCSQPTQRKPQRGGGGRRANGP